MASSESVLDGSVQELLEAVSARTPAPGGGAVAAVTASLAAGLVAMAARFAPDGWDRRDVVVARAEELRALVEPLADEDAAAYAAFLAEPTDANVERTVAIPFAIAAAAVELAELAALVESEGNANLRGDAAAGADLAAAAASIAARLVAINAPGDERAARALKLAQTAAEHAARVPVPDLS